MEGEPEDLYHTIRESGEALFKDKGSKFFGFVFPAHSEARFREHLEHLKKEHHQARHYCYAYRINPDDPYYRSNDDGEPAHSAGTPIMHALQSADVINVGAVVVRYFGGTKLGVPGLIHAYRSVTEMALDEVSIIKQFIEQRLEVTTDYDHMSRLLRLFKAMEIHIEEQKLEYDCRYLISVRKSQFKVLEENLEKMENTIFTHRP